MKDVDYRAQHRDLTVRQRPDGSCSFTGEGTAELAEFLLLSLDAFGKPTPEVDGVKDPRTAGQRRHDALLQALKLNVRARALPSIAGVTATVVLTMSAEDFERRRGLARTGHGALVPVPEAMRMTAGEYRLMNVVVDKTKGITAYSSTARLHSELQRLARAAVDGGCTFPNCPAPPGWCEMDHVIDHADGGPTRVDLAVLACHPHNEAKKRGWKSTLINGRAAWIPPAWVDRDRNRAVQPSARHPPARRPPTAGTDPTRHNPRSDRVGRHGRHSSRGHLRSPARRRVRLHRRLSQRHRLDVRARAIRAGRRSGTRAGRGLRRHVPGQAGEAELHGQGHQVGAGQADRFESIKGFKNWSTWEFSALSPEQTKVTVTFSYDLPGGLAGRAMGKALEPIVAMSVRHTDAALRHAIEAHYRST